MEPTLDSVLDAAISDAFPYFLASLVAWLAWSAWKVAKRLLSLDPYESYYALPATPISRESPEEAALRHKKTLHKSQHDAWTASFKALLPPEPVRCPHCSGPKRSSSRRIASM